NDLDLLLLAFKHGVVQPVDPQMLDPHQYSVQVVYVNYATPPGPITCRQDLLAAPQCQQQPRTGFQRVTLAEFQPAGRQPAAGSSPSVVSVPAGAASRPASAGTPTAKSKALPVGAICPVCKAEVKVRPLLKGTYVGCLC